ncbi:hypothetical protein PR048_005867 [Dryococelus australis]|uniref:Uncharacterized protein n=1 Tax=Dryococelus australis TaxID=614101 RepID=A0ABQ9I9F1_9NEOP|nr:hypothetical protein PR048_005867 [Dryococelus australis]
MGVGAARAAQLALHQPLPCGGPGTDVVQSFKHSLHERQSRMSSSSCRQREEKRAAIEVTSRGKKWDCEYHQINEEYDCRLDYWTGCKQSSTTIPPAADKSGIAVQVVTNTVTSENSQQLCTIGVVQPRVGKVVSNNQPLMVARLLGGVPTPF